VAYRVVLDADVLFPASLRDALLRLAEIELFDPLWSERILEEVKRNLLERRPDIEEDQLARMAAAMNGAFEDAQVDDSAIAELEDAMTNEAKDRHVLAAAVAGGANGIVTNNVRDFPAEACDPYGITVTTADEFLCVLFDIDPEAVCDSLIRQAAALTNPAHTVDEILDYLERGGAIEFTERVRKILPQLSG
jgi:predicted nucleic acid-binding protein